MNSGNFDFYDKTSLKSYNLNETMRYQLNMLDRLDAFTRKHCENVANLTCRLCEHLHCQKGFIEYCTICAYLHDIGKLFIPPEILQKPAKLTDEEYEIMKTHTTLGYNMCMKDLKLRPYSAGPLYHHEALNGSGYPQGLTKKDIPYEGQIIRVADEYDAIVSKRQYKSHIGISDTLKILIENANNGKNNPLIVRKLLKVVIEDIEYEIYLTQSYVENLNEEIKRLNELKKSEKSAPVKTEEIAHLEAQLEKLEHQKSRAYEDYSEELISKEVLIRYQAKYNDLSEKTRQKIASLLSETEPHRADHGEWIEHLLQTGYIKTLDRETVVEMVHMIYIFADDKIRIIYNFSDELEKWTAASQMVQNR